MEQSDRRSLRLSLAGHLEVFYSFTLSSPVGVSAEHFYFSLHYSQRLSARVAETARNFLESCLRAEVNERR